MAPEVEVTDVALRDGLQDQPSTLPTAQKVHLARMLAAAGLTSLEIGSFVRGDRVPQMADTETVITELASLPNTTKHALVFNPAGARRAQNCGVDNIRFVISASEGHSQANAGRGVDQSLQRIADCVTELEDSDIGLEAAIATAFTCPFDGDTDPARVARLAHEFTQLGIQRVHLADTMGTTHPQQLRRTLTAVRDRESSLTFGLHLHNTYGMAAATALEGHRQGIRHFDAALGGIGGCPFAPGAAGNIATDDLVHLFHKEGINTGIYTEQLVTARHELANALGYPLHSALAAASATPAPIPT